MPPKKKTTAAGKKVRPARAAMHGRPKNTVKKAVSKKKGVATVKNKRSKAAAKLVKARLDPPKYRSIARNKYASKFQRGAVAAGCDIDNDISTLCTCTDVCDSDCHNYQLFMECSPGGCPTLKNGESHCANTVIQRKAFPSTEVYRTESCGHGLRLLEDVSHGSMIIEYTGEVISGDECDARRRKMKDNEDFYYASLCGGYVLDAKFMGSSARFANHSCKPNCQMRKWVSLGEPRLVLVALMDISAGSDITYNYHCHSDGLDQTTKRQVCRCGASNCSGTIGGKVSVSENEKWEHKATLLLSMEKSCNVSTYRSHLDSAPSSAGALVESLREVIDKVDTWIRDCYSPLFFFKEKTGCNNFELCTAEEVEESLQLFPYDHVRCDEYQSLQNMCKASVRLKRKLLLTIPFCAPTDPSHSMEDIYPNARSGAPLQGGSSGTTDSVEWVTLLSVLKEISTILPIKCADDGYILCALEMLEMVSQWARPIYLRTKNPSLPTEWSDSKHSYWTAISRLSKFYKIEITPYAFMLESVMDMQLSTYIKRAQLLLESKNNYVNDAVSAVSEGFVCQPVFADTPYHDFCFGIDPDLPVGFDKLSEGKRTEPGNDDYTLHCFCRLPETEGESLTLVQCEDCSSWYHPLCINKTEMENEKTRGKGKVRESAFVCPLCDHLSNCLSSLADPVSLDWFDRFMFKKVKYSSMKSVEDVYKPDIGFSSFVQQPQNESHQFLANASEGKVMGEQPGSSDQHVTYKKPKHLVVAKRRKLCETEPWSDSDVKSFIESSSHLPIKKTNLGLLLNLVAEYTDAWRSAVDTFFKYNSEFLNRLYCFLAGVSVANMHTHRVSRSQLREEAVLLARAQYLYTSIRLISVAPRIQLIKLRLFIWVISMSTLFHRIHGENCGGGAPLSASNVSHNTGANELVRQIMCSQRENNDCLLHVDDLVKCANFGQSIFQAHHAHRGVGKGGLGENESDILLVVACHVQSLLKQLIQNTLSTVGDAKAYSLEHGLPALELVLRSVCQLSNVIEMRKHFSIAKVLNLAIRLSGPYIIHGGNYARMHNNLSCTNIVPEDPVQDCWCRGNDFGKMICCDYCGSWFHAGCMGLEKRVSLKKINTFCCIACSECLGSVYVYKWNDDC